jgi:hypothetical protein
MKCTRSRLLAALLSAAFMSLPLDAQTCLAQQAPVVTPVRTVLALTSLPTAVDAPLFFKLQCRAFALAICRPRGL